MKLEYVDPKGDEPQLWRLTYQDPKVGRKRPLQFSLAVLARTDYEADQIAREDEPAQFLCGPTLVSVHPMGRTASVR